MIIMIFKHFVSGKYFTCDNILTQRWQTQSIYTRNIMHHVYSATHNKLSNKPKFESLNVGLGHISTSFMQDDLQALTSQLNSCLRKTSCRYMMSARLHISCFLSAHKNAFSAPSLWDQTQCNAITCMSYIFYWSMKSTNPYISLVLYTFAT